MKRRVVIFGMEILVDEDAPIFGMQYDNEMKRTEPPDQPCDGCEEMCDDCADFPDNRIELYRQFKQMLTEVAGLEMWYCRKCVTSCFSREALYHIADRHKRTGRFAWVTERVKCNHCGAEWKRQEKRVVKIPISEG